MGPTDWLWAVVWLGAIVAMVWFIVVASPRPRPGDDALGILRTRFARGEISQEEFERARGALLSEIGEPKK